jgi:hypothetical protein
VSAGEYATFQITVSGTSSGSTKAPPPTVNGLTFSMQPSTSSSISSINGSFSSSVTLSYSVVAASEGAYTTPAYEIVIDGDKYTVPPATLLVGKQSEQMQSAALFQVEAPERLYVGQSAKATLRYLIRGDLQIAEGLQAPQRNCPGISQGPLIPKLVKEGARNIGNIEYRMAEIPVTITAMSEGRQNLEYTATVSLVFPEPRRVGNGFDDVNDPMERLRRMMDADSMIGQQPGRVRAVRAQGSATIDVMPLPEGAPKNFAGAVGSFTITRSQPARTGKVGEPIEIVVTLSGAGNVQQAAAPAMTGENWRIYPPTEEFKQEDPLGLSGTKTWKYLVTPQRAGTLTTPAVELSWFDPVAGRYMARTLPGEEVSVADAPYEVNSPELPAAPKEKPSQTRGADGMEPIALLYAPPPFAALTPPHHNIPFMVFQLIVAVIFGTVIVLQLRRRHELNDPLAKARRQQLKSAYEALAKARAAARKSDAAAFYEAAREFLRHAACVKDPARAPASISAADLTPLATPGDTADTRLLARIFNGIEAVRYGGGAEPTQNALARIEKIAESMEVK